ncbi:MAG: TrkH family potassium uptake protein [Clostridia bacterium]|nr:TrkH family potassium uptake protein [Lachnospiraceae bacterium]NCC00444.1 TrkH family potassium uptake protein [Clostridia bacterium]NCD02455.1 TrkH family potassium uptake protein [Clostridia bacterium]
MNYGSIRYIVGWILKVEAALMVLPMIVALVYRESTGWFFVICALLSLGVGTLLSLKKPKKTTYYAKEGYISVALGWIAMSIMGCLPFVFSGEIPSFIDAIFEIISGFTTTGASILPDVEALSKCMLFWRSFSHWVGGMGVLVFILAVLPLAGGEHNLQLMKAESPGPSVSKLVPKLRATAITLYKIYFVMTVVMILLLILGRMPVFDALCIAFGTAGTGGFGVLNSSMGSYSTYLQAVTTIFMMLFGVNFTFYFLILYRKAKDAFSMEEVRWYFGIYFGAVILITASMADQAGGLFEHFHHAAFQAASIMTTTGYSTVNFDLWPQLARLILLLLMFIGACAGSTGGGIKVSRVIVYLKSIKKEMGSLIHPRSVRAIKLDGKAVDDGMMRSIFAFFSAYVLIFVVSLMVITLDGFDFETNFSAVAATFNNIGPGLGAVGPTANFAGYSILSKIILSFDMLIGRLEIFPILLLFAPSTWRK